MAAVDHLCYQERYAATAINSRSLLGFHASLQCVHSLHLVYPGLLRMNDYWDHKIHCSLVNSQKSSKNHSFTREKKSYSSQLILCFGLNIDFIYHWQKLENFEFKIAINFKFIFKIFVNFEFIFEIFVNFEFNFEIFFVNFKFLVNDRWSHY